MDKKEKLKYKIAKDLYCKAKEQISEDNRSILLHPIDWLNDKDNMVACWKEYLDTCKYRMDDPFTVYMNFMYKNY